MSFNVSHVLFLLFQRFPGSLPQDPNLSREETKLASHLGNIIEQAVSGYIDVEEEDDDELVDDEDGDYDPEDFKYHDDYVHPSMNHVRFGDRAVPREEVLKAIEFYRQPAKGSRSISTMSSNFRWIKTDKHIEKMIKYEKEGNNFKEARRCLFQVLSSRLFEIVKEKFQNGFPLHDVDLAWIARDLNKREIKIDNFVASPTWIQNWKRSHKIGSRKITKFITRKCLLDRATIEKNAHDFVRTARREISTFSPSMVFNADQTGIQKELYGARSLAFLGEKDVYRLIQSKSSLTHSFTFMPMLFMDGTLGPKAFMVLSEPTGHFPPTRPIPNVPNLEVRAAKSHIMTKQLMIDWLQSCVFTSISPKKLLILIDSWPSFRDHLSILGCAPPGFDVTIKNIPPHTTSLIQPLDVYFNGPWKNLLKKFTTYVLVFRTDFLIAQRNNEIWMISLLYHQISAKRFQDFLKYSWKKAGYVDTCSDFETPSAYCFNQAGAEDCFTNGCANSAFIRCSRCEQYICFNHFIVSDKHLCSHP